MTVTSDGLQHLLEEAGMFPAVAVALMDYLGTAGFASPQTAPVVAAVTATTPAPAGGTGAAAGGWDTAGHRDTAIAQINALEADVAALRNTVAALVTTLQTAHVLV